jgi:xanthine dehydrogenase molybdenum-binding subunit
MDWGKKAIGWDQKWHGPGAKMLPNKNMHGMGFISINEWRWTAGNAFANLILGCALTWELIVNRVSDSVSLPSLE